MADELPVTFAMENIHFDEAKNNSWDDLHKLILQAHVPETTIIDVRSFESEDFKSIQPIVKHCFNMINRILCNVSGDLDRQRNSWKCIYSIVILCGEHSSLTLWSDNECVQLSQTVLKNLTNLLACQSVNTFLAKKDTKQILHGINIFSVLLSKLTKESWKYFPSFVHCYSWLLHQIKTPNMKEYTSLVLPVPLIILSDYVIESKVLGLDCLTHILSNISKTEIHWYIEVKLLHNTVKPLLYYREADLIIPLTKCILEITEKSKSGFKNNDIDLEWSYLDDVLKIFLSMMEYESDINRREAYSRSLSLVLENSDLSIGRWSHRLLRIIEDYTKTPSTEVDALDALNYYMKSCWPLVEHHWKYITLIVGKVIYESSNDRAVEKGEMILLSLRNLLAEKCELPSVEFIRNRRQATRPTRGK